MNHLDIGIRLARKLFEKRGNHSEAHLTEAELGALLALAAEESAKELRQETTHAVEKAQNDAFWWKNSCRVLREERDALLAKNAALTPPPTTVGRSQ